MLNNVFLNMANASLFLQMYQKQDNQQNISKNKWIIMLVRTYPFKSFRYFNIEN